ncbi:MAG TPA: hypothetical protein VN704_04825 [Verrucomicrobiae bacterium]|nr:hypothetical protein [Verrucomicrobiae bacterium]
MKIEDEITNLEISQRLKELGVKQESLLYWLNVPHCIYHKVKENGWEVEFDEDGKAIIDKIDYRIELRNAWSYNVEKENSWSAFTASQLGELLPNCILKPDAEPFDNYRIIIRKFISVDENRNQTNNFIINYECDSTELSGIDAWFRRKLINNIYDPNLANAMGKILIYLLENNLMKLEE